MGGFNFDRFVEITSSVQKPAFTVENQHCLLAMDNGLIPTTQQPFIELLSIGDFVGLFGRNDKNYSFVQKYFNYVSKTGTTVQKLIVARWHKEAAAAFIGGTKDIAKLADLKAITSGSFKLGMNGNSLEATVDLSTAGSYSNIAEIIKSAITAYEAGGEAFVNANVEYNAISGGFIITNGTTGSISTIDSLDSGEIGVDLLALLGFAKAVFSQGANAESYADYCDRLYKANNAGFSYATNELLSDEEIEATVAWAQGYNNKIRLVFARDNKDDLISISNRLAELNYTSYVLIYDPNNENVNALDCALAGSIDYEAINGTINYNFQPAAGYTPITNLGTVTDYQKGLTNDSLGDELDNAKISYVYSVGFGFGVNQQVLYGLGLMAGMFALESAHSNECWLVRDLQTAIMNAFISLPKIQLRGEAGANAISAVINPSFQKALNNGTMTAGTLSDLDKLNIINATGNSEAPNCVETNGYYYQIEPLTTEDVRLQRLRLLVCYLSSGVINKVRIINNIYGA